MRLVAPPRSHSLQRTLRYLASGTTVVDKTSVSERSRKKVADEADCLVSAVVQRSPRPFFRHSCRRTSPQGSHVACHRPIEHMPITGAHGCKKKIRTRATIAVAEPSANSSRSISSCSRGESEKQKQTKKGTIVLRDSLSKYWWTKCHCPDWIVPSKGWSTGRGKKKLVARIFWFVIAAKRSAVWLRQRTFCFWHLGRWRACSRSWQLFEFS